MKKDGDIVSTNNRTARAFSWVPSGRFYKGRKIPKTGKSTRQDTEQYNKFLQFKRPV